MRIAVAATMAVSFEGAHIRDLTDSGMKCPILGELNRSMDYPDYARAVLNYAAAAPTGDPTLRQRRRRLVPPTVSRHPPATCHDVFSRIRRGG